jgi:neutral ceramidase
MRLICPLLAGLTFSAALAAAPVPVGVARIDITPELPIRLTGYTNRPTEADRAESRLHARALAIGGDAEGPAIVIVAEVLAVSERLTEAVVAGIRARHPVPRERIAVGVTHQHTGPVIAGTAPFMFSRDLPADEQARIDRYAATLERKLVEVALEALANRNPADLSWAQGRASFAVNRRRIVDGKAVGYTDQPGGPVDHALPVMRAADAGGSVRAVLLNYACHCTTLKGGDNYVHPDWAGDAARRLETKHPGAVALVAIGCGADSDPQPRGLAAVAKHGQTIAEEVTRLFAGKMRPIGGVTRAHFRRLEIPFDREVTRAELESRLSLPVMTSYPARKFLAELDAGRALVAQHPDVGAIVLECTNMPPYAAALRDALGLPVYDIYSMITWFHAGIRPRRFG